MYERNFKFFQKNENQKIELLDLNNNSLGLNSEENLKILYDGVYLNKNLVKHQVLNYKSNHHLKKYSTTFLPPLIMPSQKPLYSNFIS